MKPWGERLYDHRIAVGGTIILLTAFFAWQTRHIVIATYFHDLYPRNHPHTKLLEKYPQFGSPLSIFLVVQVRKGSIYHPQTLAKIQQATRQIDLIPGIDHNEVFSIASPKTKHVEATVGGVQVTNFLVGPIPQSDEELEHLRNKIRSAPEVFGVLVSPQEDAALVHAAVLEQLADYSIIFSRINEIIQQLGDENHEIYAAGQPLLSGWVYFYERETIVIFAATAGAMILLLAFYARNLPGIVTPIVVSLATALWGLGIAALLSISFDPLILVLPMLLVARSFSHAIQACERYFEIYAETRNQRQACVESLVSIFPPGVLGILTDAAGLFLIAIAPIPIMEKVAVGAGFWALSLCPANVIFTPIVLSFLPPPRNAVRTAGQETLRWSRVPRPWPMVKVNGAMERILEFIVDLSRGKVAWVTGTSLLIVLLWFGVTATQLVLGDNQPGTSLLWPDSSYNTAVKKIAERFAGFDLLQIVVESGEQQVSMHSPAALELMQRVQRHMELDPEVGATFSFADLVTATNRLFHDGLPKWGIVPEEERDAAMLSQLALSGAGPGDSDRLFTRDLTAANISVWYKDHKAATVDRALNRAKSFQDAGQARDGGLTLRLASGTIGLIAAINETVARVQLEILLMVSVTIFVMCSITYRSLVAAALLLVPVNFSNLIAAGLMVHLDIGLDVNTLPVLAVGTGVGIDYAIYLMSRIREEFSRHKTYPETLSQAIMTTGRAIFFTGSALVVGMAPWYFLSSLRFQANMGLLIAVLMVINMIAALVVIPLLVSLIKPRFISRSGMALQRVATIESR